MNNYFCYALILAGCLLWTSCQTTTPPAEEKQAKQTVVSRPPVIPKPPASWSIWEEQEEEAPLLDPNTTLEEVLEKKLGAVEPMLRDALAQAQQLGLLTLEQIYKELNLSEPMTRGRLAQEVVGFARLSPLHPLRARFRDVPPNHPLAGVVEGLAASPYLKLFFAESAPGGFFYPGRPVTRFDLCMMYVYLTGQQATVAAMTTDHANQTTAGPGTVSGTMMDVEDEEVLNPEEATLELFQDAAQFSPAVKKRVALAYRDGMLASVFGLTPTRLTEETGLQGNTPVTRGQALVFLNRYLSRKSAKPQVALPNTP
jgi:hypothetical protein